MYSASRNASVDALNLDDVDPHLAALVTDGLLDAGAELLDATALASDKDSRASGLQFHLKLVGLAGDQHIADAGGAVFLVDELADPVIFLEESRITLAGGVPA